MKISGKNILITGASSGIGEACAIAFAEAGCNLILTARRKSRLDALAKELAVKHSIQVHTIGLDVRNYAEVENSLNHLPSNFQTIDILINNAGKALGVEKLQDGLLENWEEMIDTNVKGLLYVSRVVLPKMLERNEGMVINIGSIAGHEVYPGGNVYCATKHAVKAISKGMMMDVNGTNIRITSIDPGMVNTEFSLVRYKGDNEKANVVYNGLAPLLGADIAEIALFAATRPANVDLQTIVVTPTAQASASIVSRK
ncbi:MAG: SDR family NAD(P)-dependent oxidoreductase [Ignavibacteria bacterium]|jgi:NADP-dependent 3-hydroxy acid dehydrogenase YdfG|nr:SDR family NAD(P)-dependent oxidoreductase [Ignavibacteria bacterium]